MNSYRQDDWAASPTYPSTVNEAYLMGTGVVTADDTGTRPLSPPHSHADPMLAWCYRGSVWVHLQDARWRLAPGQGVWDPRAHPAHGPSRTRLHRLLHLHSRLVADRPDR